jgi:transcriptional regulator of acetoin/glycerol metabolism
LEKPSSEEAKSQITLEEHVSSGEAQTGPTIPLSQVQQQDNGTPTNIHQVHPSQNQNQPQEQQKQSELQSSSSSTTTTEEEKKKTEETTSANVSSSQQGETQQKQGITKEEEKKIVDAVFKELTPFVEQLVATEVRRVISGENDHDNDNAFIPIPFMSAGSGPIFATSFGGRPPQGFQQQQGTSGVRVRKT